MKTQQSLCCPFFGSLDRVPAVPAVGVAVRACAGCPADLTFGIKREESDDGRTPPRSRSQAALRSDDHDE
jgi:hypothetical protein